MAAPAQQLAPAAQPPAMRAPAAPSAKPMIPPAAAPAAQPASTPAAQPPASPGQPVAQSPITPAPTASPAAAPPGANQTAALPEGVGLCQCIGDKERLEFSCPGSVEACQSACGTRFSFKPDALCRAGLPPSQ